MGACYVRPPSSIDAGRIALRVLRDMEWSQKQAALCIRADYEPALSRGLAGIGPLDLHALAMLPASFWWKFFREFIKAAIAREEADYDQQRRSA